MDKQRKMFEAHFPFFDLRKERKEHDKDGDLMYIDDLTQGAWLGWKAAIASGAIAFRCANCKHLYEEKVSLCDCMPAVQEWEKVVVIEAAPEPTK